MISPNIIYQIWQITNTSDLYRTIMLYIQQYVTYTMLYIFLRISKYVKFVLALYVVTTFKGRFQQIVNFMFSGTKLDILYIQLKIDK